MKTFTQLALACLISATASAQDYNLKFENIETNHELVPAISLSLTPKLLKKCNFIIAYANRFASITKPHTQSKEIANFYVQFLYRF